MPSSTKVKASKSPYYSNFVGEIGFTVGAKVGSVRTVAVQLKTPKFADTPAGGVVFAYLSDDAQGNSIAAVAPSGGWAAGTDGLQIPVVAGKAAYWKSEEDGDIDIAITEAGTKTYYLIVAKPDGGYASVAVAF